MEIGLEGLAATGGNPAAAPALHLLDARVLHSLHPGQSVQDVREHTGFDYDMPATVDRTPAPTVEELELIRGTLGADISETYPAFARRILELNGNRP